MCIPISVQVFCGYTSHSEGYHDTLDIIGTPGVDPGLSWPVDTGSTKDYTLIRKPTIGVGSTDWSVGATEWDVYPQNTWTDMGMHTSNCASPASSISKPRDNQWVTTDNHSEKESSSLLSEVVVFPNPNTGLVHINEVIDGYFKIIDNKGRILQEGEIKENYDLIDQPAGIYMLLLQTANESKYFKVIKQ